MRSAAELDRRDLWIAFAFGIGALALRLGFLFATGDRAWPHSVWYEGDAPVWLQWARALQAGQPFEFDLPLRAPGVAFALAWFGDGLEPPFTLLKCAWCAMSALVVAVGYVVLRGELSRRASCVASALLATSFASYVLATSLNNETPYLLALTLAMALGLWQSERQSFARAALRGLLHGVGVLLRPEHVFLALALLALDAWRARRLERTFLRRRRLAAAISAVMMFMACLPWMLRSHAASVRFNTLEPRPLDTASAAVPWSTEALELLRGLPAFAREGNFALATEEARRAGRTRVELADVERYFAQNFGYQPEPLGVWTLSSAKGKLDLALANDLRGDGGFSRAALGDRFDADPPFSFARPSHLRLYQHGDAHAFDSVRSDFGAWCALVGRKLAHFANGATLGLGARNLPFEFTLVRRPVDLAAPPAEHGLAWRWMLALGAAIGLALAWRRDVLSAWMLVLVFRVAVTIAFYGYARQGALAAPAVFALVAVALDAGLARIERARPGSARVGAWLGAGALVLVAALDVERCARPPRLQIAPLAPSGALVPAPQWGAGAFESNAALSIREGASPTASGARR